MHLKKLILLFVILGHIYLADAQANKSQQGLLLKNETNIRLGSIQVLNKRNQARTRTNTAGVFTITALPGDTLAFSGDGFENNIFLVTDLADKVIYLNPIRQLPEVQVKEYSIKYDLNEAKAGYRRKSVFYTGTPHYYYVLLKPMTFIYENFKSEVIEARRFNKYASRELASYKISERYNNALIKNTIPEIADDELDDFKWQYMPTLAQLNKMSDYDIIIYIRKNYAAFKSGEIIN
jgi:hypothetical protein